LTGHKKNSNSAVDRSHKEKPDESKGYAKGTTGKWRWQWRDSGTDLLGKETWPLEWIDSLIKNGGCPFTGRWTPTIRRKIRRRLQNKKGSKKKTN